MPAHLNRHMRGHLRRVDNEQGPVPVSQFRDVVDRVDDAGDI